MKKLLPILMSIFFVTGCYTRLERPVNEIDGELLLNEDELEIIEVVYPAQPPEPPKFSPMPPPVIIRPILPATPAPPSVEKARTNDQNRDRSIKKKDRNLRNNTGERSSQSGRKR